MVGVTYSSYIQSSIFMNIFHRHTLHLSMSTEMNRKSKFYTYIWTRLKADGIKWVCMACETISAWTM